jgi:polyisoprenoid-binding protein YceI
VETESIKTADEDRNKHLRSADFLNVEEYPTMKFESTRVEQIDDTHGQLIGDLTIKDETREITLDVEYYGLQQDPWGNTRATFSGETTISRKNWGLNWNVALEAGGFLVSDKLELTIELQLVRESEAVPA